MNMIRRIFALTISLFLVLTLTACDNTDKAYIYFSLSEEPSTLDPQIAQSETELMIVRNIFEGLLREDKDGKIVCGVAKDFQKNGLTYTFNLRKDAFWSNEEPVTAYDFLFAFERAVTPKTQSPFSKRLWSIKNAKSILEGDKSISELGVQAVNAHTLKITLSKEDKNFLHTLTTSIAMPCQEKFFDEAAGKYGLNNDTTLSNGSYRMTKWGKEVFGIRLYKNKFYKGDFQAKNAAVFFSIDKDRTPVEVLAQNDADLAFISPTDLDIAKQAELKTADYQNICWFLTVSDGFSKDIRKSLINLAHPKVFKESLKEGYSAANSIYPPALSDKAISAEMPDYNLSKAKNTFKNAIERLEDKKFPTGVVLYYYDDGFSKNVVTDIVGHWQNQLGAFVNIETVSAPEVLQGELIDQTNALSIFPIVASSSDVGEYLENFKVKYSGENLTKIQQKLLKSKNIVPLMTQKTIVAYNQRLHNLNFTLNNNGIDFSYVIKTDK